MEEFFFFFSFLDLARMLYSHVESVKFPRQVYFGKEQELQ